MIGFHPAIDGFDRAASDARRVIQEQIRDIVSSLRSSAVSRSRSGPAAVRHFAIGHEHYRIVVDLMPPNDHGDSVPVATVERLTDARAANGSLSEQFRLTPKESRVAILLAQRRSNAEIAETLRISPHTARRHTENVMLKLNVTSRYDVEAALTAVA